MNNLDAKRLKNELRQFTGTERYYYNPIFERFRYTDGVKFLAEKANAYWLIEYIFSSQPHRSLRNEQFQVWKIAVKKDNTARVSVEDGNDNTLVQFNLEFTDFPLKEFALWLIDNTLILPSEY